MTDTISPLEALASMPPPIHPGEFIREELLPLLDISLADLGIRTGVPVEYLHRLTQEDAAITPEVAIALSSLEEIDPLLWMELQAVYDLWYAYRRFRER